MNPQALACVADAIPAGERASHFALLRSLFRSPGVKPRGFPHGMSFEFDVHQLEAVTRFVANERRCCPFLRFEIAVPAGTERLTLTLSGPDGTREFLGLELLGTPSGASTA